MKDNKRSLIPSEMQVKDLHQFLLGIVSPRPIAFVSTVNEAGVTNLAPYSFFNAFSSNPPIVVFSSNRRVRDNTTKDTLHNVKATGEVVINAVSHSIVRQMAISSVEFDAGVSEFTKTGLTPVSSDLVKPPRILESPAALECKVQQIIPLGEHGGAGNLIVCEVVKIHIDESVIDENNRPNPHKMDLMGRMGRAYYARASGEAIHTILQGVTPVTLGYDALPKSIQKSTILTGNEIGLLCGLTSFPTEPEWKFLAETDQFIKELIKQNNPIEDYHTYAQKILATHNIDFAIKILFLGEFITKGNN